MKDLTIGVLQIVVTYLIYQSGAPIWAAGLGTAIWFSIIRIGLDVRNELEAIRATLRKLSVK